MSFLNRKKFYILLVIGGLYMLLMFYIHQSLIVHNSVKMTGIEGHFFHDHNKPMAEKMSNNPSVITETHHHAKTLSLTNLSFRSDCDNKLYTDSHFKRIASTTYVYTAYYDNRKGDSNVFVRFTILKSTQGNSAQLWCHFHDHQTGNIIETVPTQDLKGNMFNYYELCENHALPFGGFISSCKVPTSLQSRPCSVYLSASKTFSTEGASPAVLLPLRPTQTEKLDHDFAICVPALFGPVSTRRIIQFFEVSKKLGSQKVFLYHTESSPSTRRVMQHYIESGFLEVIPWQLPDLVTNRGSSSTWNYAQILNVNDCLLRAMSESKFVAFNDIDEFIVPRAPVPSSVQSAWHHIQKVLWKENTCGVCFPSVYYDLKRGSHDNALSNEAKLFEVLANTERSSVVSNVRTKCLVQPLRIFEMGIHHISKPNEEFYNNYRVQPNIVLLNHYRDCIADYGMSCINFEKDNSIGPYTKDLMNTWQKLSEQLSL